MRLDEDGRIVKMTFTDSENEEEINEEKIVNEVSENEERNTIKEEKSDTPTEKIEE